jgi:arginyl-tRNA synthetase
MIMKALVGNAVLESLRELQKEWNLETIPDVEIEVPRNESMGDYATTVAMRLARPTGKPPREIAEEISAKISASHGDLFDNIEIAGPGFINFRLRREAVLAELRNLLKEGHSTLRSDIGGGTRIQVEFVSANPTGPLHIGHGRGAAVGNALCNILKAAGYDVEREFYINDAGLQVKLLGLSVYARYQQQLGNDAEFPEDGYKGEYIAEIAARLRETEGDRFSNVPFDNCRDFITNFAYKMMLAEIAKDLKDFGVVFDRWQSERELHEKGKVQDALNTLQEKGLLYEKEGARWFRSSEFDDNKDRVVIKNDGEFTYFASDIAYHKDKLDRGFEEIIDIWGADHHGYIPRIRSVLEAFDLPKERFSVILIQMVTLLRRGQPVQMSKRAGNFITLREVLDEVGPDITKFIFLTRKADSHLDFDIETAKEQSSENPVFYVQYAFARISSLFRQAREREVLRQGTEAGGQGSAAGGRSGEGAEIEKAELSLLKEDEEISLIKKVLQYPSVFEGAAIYREPHRITYYLQELAGMFHSYYYRHRIVIDDHALSLARLAMCRAVQIVLKEGLGLLGITAPERM